MRSYQLNSNLRLILHDGADADDSLIGAYEVYFKELLSTLSISNSGVMEVANLSKHKFITKQQHIYPYLHKRSLPAFTFLLFKN